MSVINFLINEVFVQAPIFLGVIALVGLLLQKRSGRDVLEGTIKVIVGIVVLNAGIGVFLGSLLPLTTLLNSSFGVTGVLPDCFGPFGVAMQTMAIPISLAFVLAFIIHLVLVRIIPFPSFKNVFLTGHIMLFNTSIAAIVINTTLGWTDTALIVSTAVLTALFWTCMPAIARPFSKFLTKDQYTLGHLQTMDLPMGALAGKMVQSKRSDEVDLPGFLSVFTDYTVILATLIPIVYILIGFVAGAENVAALSGGANWVVWLILQGIGFAAGVAIVLFGVRMFLAAMIPAFEGIAKTILPGSQPALDSPLFFQYSPTGVILGFLACFGAMVVFTLVQVALGMSIIIFPGPIFFFFDGALAGVFGDRYGGWKASLIAGALMGILIDFVALLTYPLQAQFFQGTGLIFGGGDYILWAPLYWILALIGGKVTGFATYGVVSIIAGILVLIGVLAIRNQKAKENDAATRAAVSAVPVQATK
jgi:PTS system ascorbate-specific IIC component